jgi:hypothetical protein
MTSSVLICVLPACFEKLSKSFAVLAICAQTSSVRAPMNCGVALFSEPLSRSDESVSWPMEYQSADLRR